MRGFIIIFSVFMVLQNVAGLAFENPKTLIVVGVQNESGAREWDEHLVALGVTNLISEELFKTGRYIPIETNPEVIKTLNEMIAFNRQSSKVRLQPSPSTRVPQTKSDAIAYGIIRRFTKKRKRAMAGCFSFAKVTASLEIEIIMQERGGIVRSAVGKGEGATFSKGLLVQIREEKIRFDQTSLGTVASDAVKHAVLQIYPK